MMGRKITLATVVAVTLVLITKIVYVRGKVLTIEGEEMEIIDRKVNYRSEASNEMTVLLFKGDTIFFDLCVMSGTFVYVEQVIYSNDGQSDQIEVTVDNHALGVFETGQVNGHGAGWNQFRSSGNFSDNGTMIEGRHRVALSVLSADPFGVEVDYILLHFNGTQGVASLKCGVFCFDDISYSDHNSMVGQTPATPSGMQGVAMQLSHQTNCAEEDNINIPVFHDSVSKFEVVASLPKYMSFSNNRGADWANCSMVESFWTFTDVVLDNYTFITNGSGKLSYDPLFDNGHIGSITVTFSLNGSSIGSTDAEIGTNVSLTGIRFSGGPLLLKFRFLDRYGHFSAFQEKQVDQFGESVVFNTPDYSFRESDDNIINIEVFSCPSCVGTLQIDTFYMIKRNILSDVTTLLYKDTSTILEGVNMDMWWRINETMTVTITTTGRTFSNVDYLRVYQRVPWADNSYSQVFVMYQDGNVRLLPTTPHGLDWIPFGSSVMIGQSDPKEFRPVAPVFHIEFDPQKILKLYYVDGGMATLLIKTTLLETKLLISNTVFTRDLAHFPFFTFRSMWVADGNGDVDHVTVDGTETRPVLGNWDRLHGNFFAFYRKCISKHNTLSPDILLKILH